MSKTAWEARPGIGVAVLETVTEDVRGFNGMSEALARVKQQATEHNNPRAVVLDHIIEQSRQARCYVQPDTVVDQLDETEANQLLRESRKQGLGRTLLMAAATQGLGTAMDNMRRGRKIDTVPRPSRFRLEVLESGVVLCERGRPFTALDGTHHPQARLLEAGETFEYRFKSMQTTPPFGGRLSGVEPLLRDVSFSGLVAPDTGEPQVALEVLRKIA